MSTKTSIKRIALVAVSALGFGLLSVVPAKAALATDDVVTPVSATLDSASTTLAGRVGQEVSIPVKASIASFANVDKALLVASFAASLTAQPTGSALTNANLNLASGTIDLGGTENISKGIFYGSSDFNNAAVTTSAITSNAGSVTAPPTINYTAETQITGAGTVAAKASATVGTLTFTPTAVGVYTVVVWNEKDRNIAAVPAAGKGTKANTASAGNGTDIVAALSGSESYQTFTINVTSTVSTISMTAINSTCAKDAALTNDDYGCLIKVSLKDAGGNIAIPATGESVVLTPSSKGDVTYVNSNVVASTPGAAYSLSAADFGQSGVAWVNVNSADAETFTITATFAGSASASVSVTTRTLTDSATDASPRAFGTSGFAANAASSTTAGRFEYPIGSVTATFSMDTAYAATTYSGVLITDAKGVITGVDGSASYTNDLRYALASTVSTDTDGLGTDGALFSVAFTTTNIAGDTAHFTVAKLTGTQRSTQVDTVTTSAGTATATPSTINAVSGATNTISVNLKDNFKRALANTTLTASVTGRNPTTVAKTAVTDSLGNASFSFTDANTTSVIASDTISITGGSSAITVTILYGAANAPSTITLTSTGDTDVIPGTTTTDIDASATGATGASATASAVVKNSAGSAVAGVAVTFTVTGLVGAEVHTTKATVYTDTTGKAVSYVSSYAAGKATVTATAGTATASDDIYFKQQTITEARTIAVAATGGLVTATVKDRYGNVIEGVNVYATRSGTGYFGSGASTASGETDKNGQVEFNFVGTGTVTVQLGDATAASATYGQSYAAAGYDADAVNGTAITAYTAGTSATNQKGLGGSLSPAGINSASVAVTAADAGVTAAEAATDAASEAIDAANAATDAANLAAEAADAATVAAEEARDAADAATAAVEELATQVATLMAALKAQITTLANTVAKIAKKVKA
jgi:hypothetical protein